MNTDTSTTPLNAMFPLRLQVIHEAGRAHRAVALTQQVLWGVPAAVVVDVLDDEPPDRVDVLVHAPEVLVLRLPERVADAGPDGVDHDEVGHVEGRLLVVHDLVRRRRRRRRIVVRIRRGPRAPM